MQEFSGIAKAGDDCNLVIFLSFHNNTFLVKPLEIAKSSVKETQPKKNTINKEKSEKREILNEK